MRVVAALHGVIEWGLRPFDRLPPWVALLLLSVVTGVVVLWCVGKLTAQRRLARARERAVACIYEMRLFADAPLAVLRAQLALIYWSVRYVALTLPALVVLAGPLLVGFEHLDARFGRRALAVGETAVVRLRGPVLAEADVTAACSETCGVSLPIFVDRPGRDAYVRVVPRQPGVARLTLMIDATAVDVPLLVDREGPVVTGRYAGLPAWWRSAVGEPLTGPPGLHAVEVPFPVRASDWFGLGLPWWAAWMAMATAVALLVRRRMGVVL
ncbi:MAG: hypothetical protein B7733_15285 [Myxococcales bacterium FL481]|nr:MAG: hypothetical protein B7733_15285 [Myxococcales bacterium FL481]